MRAINTLAPTAHQFYRLMPDVEKATSVMPRIALVNGGTHHACYIPMPRTMETRTKSGKRLIYTAHTL